MTIHAIQLRTTFTALSRPCFSRLLLSRRFSGSRNLRAIQKFGLGGHQWANTSLETYNDIVRTALHHKVDTLEAGQEDGPLALAQAYRSALKSQPELEQQPVTLLVRIGYRTVVPGSDVVPLLEHDVKVDELRSEHENTTIRAPVLHNIGPDAIVNALETSVAPLLQLSQECSQVNLAILLHNPEVQGSQLGAPMEEREAHIQSNLSQGFAVLQEMVRSETLQAYGVVSNGINLPQDHPLYLDHQTIDKAVNSNYQKRLQDDAQQLEFILQLPDNLLERRGMDVAQQIRLSYPHWNIYGMRPLTCYPDLGTGSGKPILLADHYLQLDNNTKTGQWTNRMAGPPESYTRALHLALAHLDAEDLVQKKLSPSQTLTPDEQDTLEAAQWVQSLLQDVDAGLESVRSVAAQNEYIMTNILPMLHETLDGCDDETATLLQEYFQSYFPTLHYASAKNVRKLLRQGEPGSNIPKCTDLQPEVRLQEYALQYALQNNIVDKVLVGCLTPDHVEDTLAIVDRVTAVTEEARG